MLNARGVAAVCPIFCLARLHPSPDDLSFPSRCSKRTPWANCCTLTAVTPQGPIEPEKYVHSPVCWSPDGN